LDTIVRCNLQSLAQIAGKKARNNQISITSWVFVLIEFFPPPIWMDWWSSWNLDRRTYQKFHRSVGDGIFWFCTCQLCFPSRLISATPWAHNHSESRESYGLWNAL
jgi:hypothetical protein